MRVFLLSSNIANTPYSVYPLGLSMVASSLNKAGHEVKQFDFLASNRSLQLLGDEIQGFKPDIIGISIRNIDNVNILNEQRYIDEIARVTRYIRSLTEAKIVLGGSGFSIMPEEILKKIPADYGIVGEGESLILDLISKMKAGKSLKERILRSNHVLAGEDIPAAHYDEKIMNFYLKSGNVASVQTKRGCAHKCIYCSYPLLEGEQIRSRNPKLVINDIENLIARHGAKYIFFTDSVFNDSKGNYLRVLEEMKLRKISIPWTAFFKPESFEDETLALMQETGLKAAELGADAPSDATLKKLGKAFLFKDIIKCNESFARHNIATANYFMFGCPGETKRTVLEGINNIKSLQKTVSFIFMGIRILPRTPLARIAEKEGIIKKGQDLLEPVYYIAPGINHQWLKDELTRAFKGLRSCVFPPDSLDSSLAFLHKLGYSGSLWEMLIPGKASRNRKDHAGKQI